MLAKYVTCNVRRDMTTIIPVACFEHEVELLKAIHGDSNIEIADLRADELPVELDATDEYDRLTNTYGLAENGQPHAERVFGRSARGLEAFAYRKPGSRKRKSDAADADPDNEAE